MAIILIDAPAAGFSTVEEILATGELSADGPRPMTVPDDAETLICTRWDSESRSAVVHGNLETQLARGLGPRRDC
jgi:hypothetical protein